MTRDLAISLYRVGFALLALAAIVVQLLDLAGKGTLNPVNYFSYFTIQSNLIGVAALLTAVLVRASRPPWVDLFRRRRHGLPHDHLPGVRRPARGHRRGHRNPLG